jgi:hypothetical protein
MKTSLQLEEGRMPLGDLQDSLRGASIQVSENFFRGFWWDCLIYYDVFFRGGNFWVDIL